MGGRKGGRGGGRGGKNNGGRNSSNGGYQNNGYHNNQKGNNHQKGKGKKNGRGGCQGRNDNSDMRDNDMGLSHVDRKKLIENIRPYWKEGSYPDDIAAAIADDSHMCPYDWRNLPNKLRKLTDTITELLKREKLTNYKGQPLPLRWPETLQEEIAAMFLDDKTPEDMSKALKNNSEYRTVFNGWNWNNAAAAIGHFTHTNDMHAVHNGSYVEGYDANNDTDTPEDWSTEESRYILESAADEEWAQALLENRRQQRFNPNHVNNQWAFQEPAPKWGEPSRIVIRQASPHDPMAPDPRPDPVRPVANAEFHPRKCQGTHGCSRFCAWNRDFVRSDGWSQHNFNNKYGISMYLQEKEDAAIFEDADGDVLMAGAFPPWMLREQDMEWRGSAVKWSRCLASNVGEGEASGPGML